MTWTKNITDTIAEALGQHRVEKGMRINSRERLQWLECGECAWRSETFPIGTAESEMESARRGHQTAAVLAALKRDRIAVTELPERMTETSNVAEPLRALPNWEVGDSWACLLTDGDIEFEANGQEVYGTVSPSKARSLAAALLAAADAAEEGKP